MGDQVGRAGGGSGEGGRDSLERGVNRRMGRVRSRSGGLSRIRWHQEPVKWPIVAGLESNGREGSGHTRSDLYNHELPRLSA